jgi:hypothetical protein
VKPSWTEEVSGAAMALLLGALAFFIVVGPRALRPTNIAWLAAGDPAAHYLGWHFFRNTDWSFPIGLNPDYGLELSNAILFSDSNPLLAFLFKPFSSILPETFQYFGIWLLACFVLQTWLAWKLVGLISENPAIRILGAGLFVFAPPMLWRLHGHLNLVGHFLILAALYLLLRPTQEKRTMLWTVVLAGAAMVHAYLLAMAAILWLADLVQVLAGRQRSAQLAGAEFAGIAAVVVPVCWQTGYFAVESGVSDVGYGFYRMNVLSLFDANGWSHVLKDLPQAKGDYEGFNYLGLGLIALALFSLPALIAGRTGLLAVMRKRAILLLPLTGLLLFALSNKVGIGAQQFEFSLTEPLLRAANVFRSSGRMFWPVFYLLVLAIIFVVVRGNSPRVAASLLVIALVIQVVDTKVGWQGIRKRLMAKPMTEWVIPLKDAFWTQAASKYQNVRWIVPAKASPHWKELATYAARHRLGTDAVHQARVDTRKLKTAQQKAWAILGSGQYEPNALYVLDAAALKRAALNYDPEADLLARVDGFNVLAPGWKKCAVCRCVDSELRLTDIFPPITTGERIRFSQAAGNTAYLTRGWSGPETWGTWSDGPSAEIVLPLSTARPRGFVIEANALVSPSHPKQDVEIRVNGALAATVSLTMNSGNQIEVPIPAPTQEGLAARGTLHVELRFPDAVRPKDIGLNDDPRNLALGLRAITVN